MRPTEPPAKTLVTRRLTLRPFSPRDAESIQRLANDRAVSSPTARLPHPYEVHHASEWIATHKQTDAAGGGLPLAITRTRDRRLLGAISLDIRAHDQTGVLGYWLGQPFWRQGYATEAALAVVERGLALGLQKIAAEVLANNAGSIRVLKRCGLHLEGILRSHVQRNGARIDVCCFARFAAEKALRPARKSVQVANRTA